MAPVPAPPSATTPCPMRLGRDLTGPSPADSSPRWRGDPPSCFPGGWLQAAADIEAREQHLARTRFPRCRSCGQRHRGPPTAGPTRDDRKRQPSSSLKRGTPPRFRTRRPRGGRTTPAFVVDVETQRSNAFRRDRLLERTDQGICLLTPTIAGRRTSCAVSRRTFLSECFGTGNGLTK